MAAAAVAFLPGQRLQGGGASAAQYDACMGRPTPMHRRLGRRSYALIGLAGAVLSGIGDVLILGRSCSGQEFDRGTGVVPSHLDPEERWRSLFNGAVLGPQRIQIGTVTGVLGIGVLQLPALRGITWTMRAEAPRLFCARSATAFAVTGALAHLCCGSVILAYRTASQLGAESHDGRRPSPRSATPVLAVSAGGALIALAIFSAGLTWDALGRRGNPPTSSIIVTPLPCVVLTLLTFGALPAPVGGWARPASMSIGLAVYFAVTAASVER